MKNERRVEEWKWKRCRRVTGVGVGDESRETVKASVGGDPTKLLDF
jgi:hypothetical protein